MFIQNSCLSWTVHRSVLMDINSAMTPYVNCRNPACPPMPWLRKSLAGDLGQGKWMFPCVAAECGYSECLGDQRADSHAEWKHWLFLASICLMWEVYAVFLGTSDSRECSWRHGCEQDKISEPWGHPDRMSMNLSWWVKETVLWVMSVLSSKVMFLTDFTEKPQYVPGVIFMRWAGSQWILPTSLLASFLGFVKNSKATHSH